MITPIFLDPTLTVSNVTDVMEKVTVDKRRQLWEWVLGERDSLSLRRRGIAPILSSGLKGMMNNIFYGHSSEKEKLHACIDVYVNCHPESSWEHLTSLLYFKDEMAAMDQARPFLPPRGTQRDIVNY